MSLICLLESMIFVVCQQTWKVIEVGNSSAKLLRAFICPSFAVLTETCWWVFPSHIHSVPTAVANCRWWKGFSRTSDESAQMHSWCFGTVSTITCCVGTATAAVILENRKRCQLNHSIHTLLIFWYSHSIKRTGREELDLNQSDSQDSNPSTSHSRGCSEHIIVFKNQTHKIQIRHMFNFTFKRLLRAHFQESGHHLHREFRV